MVNFKQALLWSTFNTRLRVMKPGYERAYNAENWKVAINDGTIRYFRRGKINLELFEKSIIKITMVVRARVRAYGHLTGHLVEPRFHRYSIRPRFWIERHPVGRAGNAFILSWCLVIRCYRGRHERHEAIPESTARWCCWPTVIRVGWITEIVRESSSLACIRKSILALTSFHERENWVRRGNVKYWYRNVGK